MPNTHKTSVVTERISRLAANIVQANPFQDNFDRNREAFIRRVNAERERIGARPLVPVRSS